MGGISRFFNFDNIGQKIKSLTKWSCWITILLIWIASVITWFIFIFNSWMMDFIWIPMVASLVGPFIVWIGSWTMYAFGEITQGIIDMKNGSATTAQASAVRQTVDNQKLDKLNALRAKGLITEEEYTCAINQGN